MGRCRSLLRESASAKNKVLVVFAQILLLLLFPIAMFPTWIPVGAELWLNHLKPGTGIPIYLILSTALLALLALVYHHALSLQGNLLQRRERRILQAVTARTD